MFLSAIWNFTFCTQLVSFFQTQKAEWFCIFNLTKAVFSHAYFFSLYYLCFSIFGYISNKEHTNIGTYFHLESTSLKYEMMYYLLSIELLTTCFHENQILIVLNIFDYLSAIIQVLKIQSDWWKLFRKFRIPFSWNYEVSSSIFPRYEMTKLQTTFICI